MGQFAEVFDFTVTPPIIQPIHRLGVHRCGLNVANLTGVIFSAQDLFKGDNLACVSFSILQQGIPNFLSTIVNDLALVTSFVNKVCKSQNVILVLLPPWTHELANDLLYSMLDPLLVGLIVRKSRARVLVSSMISQGINIAQQVLAQITR